MKNRREEVAVLDDEQIIDLYWRREENAIRETDNNYGKFLFRIAFHILHDRMDCEECQNDTYFSVWNAIPPTRPKVFLAFITQIMRRTAINCYKKKSSQKRIPSKLTVCMEDLEHTLHGEDSAEAQYESEGVGEILTNM